VVYKTLCVFQDVDCVARCCAKFRILFRTIDLEKKTNRTLTALDFSDLITVA